MKGGMAVATPTLIYAWTKSREEFEKIKLPAQEFEWKEDESLTLIKNDGNVWERRIFAKSVDGDVSVVFQWFEDRVKGG